MARPDDLDAWLHLLLTPGVGRDKARKLLAACGSPEAVRDAKPASLRELVGPSATTLFQAAPEAHADLLARTLAWLDADPARHVLTLGDADYPALLLQTADPPLLLYAHGRLDLLNAAAMAIVGSRNASAQGLDNARAFAQHLSQAGLTIISGMALGIDGAHTKAVWRAAAAPSPSSAPGWTLSTLRATARWRTASPSRGCCCRSVSSARHPCRRTSRSAIA